MEGLLKMTAFPSGSVNAILQGLTLRAAAGSSVRSYQDGLQEGRKDHTVLEHGAAGWMSREHLPDVHSPLTNSTR